MGEYAHWVTWTDAVELGVTDKEPSPYYLWDGERMVRLEALVGNEVFDDFYDRVSEQSQVLLRSLARDFHAMLNKQEK